MLFICKANVSVRCIKIRSAHGTSAATKECICHFCREAMHIDPSLKLKSIFEGEVNVGKSKKDTGRNT